MTRLSVQDSTNSALTHDLGNVQQVENRVLMRFRGHHAISPAAHPLRVCVWATCESRSALTAERPKQRTPRRDVRVLPACFLDDWDVRARRARVTAEGMSERGGSR